MAGAIRQVAATLMLTALLAACSGSSTSTAFDFAEDDLCEWIGGDVVSNIVADAYRQFDASPIPVGFEQSWVSSSYLGCAWSVSDTELAGGSYSRVGLIRTEHRSKDTGRPFAPHPALSRGVQVGPRGALAVGAFGDFVPGMEVRLLIQGQDYTVEFWHSVPPGFDGDANAVLSIADGLLREMGWI